MREGAAPRERTMEILDSLRAPLLPRPSLQSVEPVQQSRVTSEPLDYEFHDTDWEREELGSGDVLYNEDGSYGGDNDKDSLNVVDLDEMAEQMDVRVEDLLQALHVGRGDSTAPDLHLRSLYPAQERIVSTRSPRNIHSINSTSEPDDDGEGGEAAALRWYFSRSSVGAQCLRLAVEDATSGSIEGEEEQEGQRELTHEQDGGVSTNLEGLTTMSVYFFSSASLHGSASHVTSSPSLGSVTRAATPSLPAPPPPPPPPLPARRIRFGSRVVTKVCVYGVDNEVYLGLHFRQHWSSWAALLTGFLLESLFEVHLDWFAHVGGATTTKTVPIAHWVYTYRAILSVVCGLMWLLFCFWRDRLGAFLAGSAFSPASTSHSEPRGVRIKSLFMTFLASLCFTFAVTAMVLANERWGSSLFFTATVMHCIWILLYRLLRQQMVFFVESCGALFLIVGNVLCNVDSMRIMGPLESLYGNLLMTVGSILFAAAFLLMAYGLQRGMCCIMGLTVSVGVSLPLVILAVGACYGYPMTPGAADSMNAGFQHANALQVLLLAIEDMLFNIMYIYALLRLDVLSVSACFSLKVAVIPIVSHYIVWNHAAELPPVLQARWGPLLFVGVGVVAVAAAVVMYFASVRRRFVARRLFHMHGLRKVPDPYRRKMRTRRK